MDLLFMNGHLDAALEATRKEMVNEVQAWDPDQLLVQSESEIAVYLAEKYSVACPTIMRDAIYADEPADVQQRVQGSVGLIDVPATRVTVHIPYEGERVFFSLRPNSFTASPPRATVTDRELILVFESRQLVGDAVRSEMDHTIGEIERWLGWSRPMAEAHNLGLEESALNAIRRRKEKLLADRQTVAGLGIPVRSRGDAPTYSVPVTRSRPSVERPSRVKGDYAPEPTLSDSDYEAAIRVISSASRQLERTPATTRGLSEESRRDLLLVALNGQFEGQAGAEMFNGSGKTDILLRVDDRNVFIAECKIWRGEKSFTKAIDQLAGYLVWRDTKAALILFIEAESATAVIDKAAAALASHPRCIRAEPSSSVERRNFVLLAESDPGREIHVALLPFVIAPAGADQ